MRSRRTTLQAATALAVILSAATLTLGAAQPVSSAEPTRPVKVGELPVVAPEGASTESGYPAEHYRIVTTAVDSKARRSYQVYSRDVHMLLSVHDLDSRRLLRSAPVPETWADPSLYAFDEAKGRLYLPLGEGVQGFMRIDGAAFEAGAADAVKEFRTVPTEVLGSQLIGFHLDTQRNKLLMWLNGPQYLADGLLVTTPAGRGRQGYYVNWLLSYDVETGALDWVHRVSQCNGGVLTLLFSNARPFYSRDGRALNVLCGLGETGGNQLVALEVDTNGKPTGNARFTATGPYPVNRVVMDPVRERMHAFLLQGYLVVLNWRDGQVIGTVAISPTVPGNFVIPGLDHETGRLYAFVSPAKSTTAGGQDEPGGLLVIDAYRTPVPQALAFRQPDVTMPVLDAIVPVASARPGRPRTLLARPTTAASVAAEPHYRVIIDPVPLSADPPAGDIDRTTDTDEVDGKTERSFAGETSGYGARSLIVGGAVAVGQTGGAAEAEILGKCGVASRDARAGYVRRASLSNLVTAAVASPFDPDAGTQEDFRDLSRCWVTPFGIGTPPPEGSNVGPGLNPSRAECSGEGTDTKGDEKNAAATATVTCDAPKQEVVARSAYPAVGGGPVSVGQAVSTTRLVTDGERGLVTAVESAAENITIESGGAYLRIGRVVSYAEAASNGRKSKAPDPRTKWTVLVCGVQTPQFTQQGCAAPDQAVRALNEAGRGRVVFKQPRPEPYLLEGTPGGYLAGVQREAGDMSLTRLEHGDELFVVPGLEIQVRNDSTKTYNRYVVQLAGVRAVSAYGISVLPPALSGEGGPTGGGDGPLIPDLGQELTDFVTTLASGAASGSGATGSILGDGGLIDNIGRVLKYGWDLLVRDPLDFLLLVGVWSTLAMPAYLAVRRRRLLVAA